MTHAEALALATALLAILWRQCSRDRARPWLALATLLLGAGLAFARELLAVSLMVRLLLAAALAQAVSVRRTSQAAIGGAVVALGWSAPEGATFGHWPLVIAATLLAVGLPALRSTAPPSTPSRASAAL